MIGKQLVMHLPELPLLSSTVAGFSGLKSLFVDPSEREVTEDVFQFAGGNIFFLELRVRLTDVSCAVGSLIIGEFY